jgi:hypothetical protein
MITTTTRVKDPAKTPALPNVAAARSMSLQRKCARGGSNGLATECEGSGKSRPSIQRLTENSENEPRNSEGVPPVVHGVLGSAGQPLDIGTRAFFESRFGHDFGQVRIHTDETASRSAQAVNARAYTVGQHVVFRAGQFSPQTKDGQHLLAHELTHVVQQRSHGHDGGVQAHSSDAFEEAADLTADRVMSGGTGTGMLSDAPRAIQRETPAEPEGATSTACGPTELFTELDLPWPVPNSYFRGSGVREYKNWDAELTAAKNGKCLATGRFRNITLGWDLGNPNIGSLLGMDLNKNDITLDINPSVVYSRQPCCTCFAGTANWSFEVSVSRKKDGKTETGNTAAPIVGNMASKACSAQKCCSVDQALDVSIWLGDANIDASIKGRVNLSGASYSE